MAQKYVLGCGELTDWTAGDLSGDDKINSSDLSFMKKLLTESK